MAPKPPKKPKKGTPPPIDKLLVPAVGIGLALLGYQFFRGLTSDLTRVNVHDELELRDVLFGEGGSGNSYAVLCQDEESTLPISSVFSDAIKEGSSPALFRLLDCSHVLAASGKSIADRFELDLKIRPTVFISGASVDKPTQVPAKHLKTGAMLAKLLRSKFQAHAAKIETTQDLRTKCLDKDICALLLKGSKKPPKYIKDAMQKLLEEFPTVAFCSINSNVLYMKNIEAEYLPELKGEEPRFVVFRKLSGSIASGGDRLITSIAPLTTGVSYGTMSNLVAGVVRKTITTTKIPSLPVVKTRTKKLVEEEKAKRQRKSDQERRAQDKTSGSSSSSGATANDGSKEGRRLERERRRAEHRAKSSLKDKTPEEIAEMERQRRIRMEAESAKWNVAPDDAPPTGEDYDILDDDDDEYDDLDDGGRTTTIVDGDEDDENGDEVIDLD